MREVQNQLELWQAKYGLDDIRKSGKVSIPALQSATVSVPSGGWIALKEPAPNAVESKVMQESMSNISSLVIA